MPIQELRVPFGERHGEMVAPADVPRGLACGCFCPSCGASLVAKRMQKSGLCFFAHHNAPECPGGYETALHRMAKQIIQEAGYVTLAAKKKPVSVTYQGLTHRDTLVFPEKRAGLTHIVQEQRVEQWVPDVSAKLLGNGIPVFIEIRVTHEVEDNKAQGLNNVIEIDLRGLYKETTLDVAAVSEAVLHDAPRKWHRCSLYDHSPAIQKAKDALLAKAKEEWIAQQKAQQFMRYQDQKRRDFQKELEQLAVMQTSETVEQRQAVLRCDERYAKATSWLASRLNEHPKAQDANKVMPLWDIPQKNDWIFSVHRLVWQAKVVFGLIFKKSINQRITVPEVLAFLESEYPLLPWVSRLDKMKRDYKKQGKNRQQWYGEEGAWFLDHQENRAIISPYRVVIQYLDHLAASKANLLTKHADKPVFFVRGNSIAYWIAQYEKNRRAEEQIRKAALEQARKAQEAHAKQQECRQATRDQRNKDAEYCAAQLTVYAESGAKALSFCCHCRAAYGYAVTPNQCLKCGQPTIYILNTDDIELASIYPRVKSVSASPAQLTSSST
ncbi:hypothetical protein [Vreelandella massiliensis]|uniref:hypothetical protein n=1 Tax=Vreelandella massiliensis TaxID=1816686 RepID=UPI00096AA72F|nr:hypothetical protein [Halomonas massiliensis]